MRETPVFPWQPDASSESHPSGEGTPWWEDAAIVLAILSFWPVLLRWPGAGWRPLMYGMGVLMVVIFVRRTRRLVRLRREQHARLGGPE
ncbi:MAG: hypothetical protein HYU36_22815 [Planctomycetes bacterium]|nr:hypothetical protein [Planctomycetota bacterium]